MQMQRVLLQSGVGKSLALLCDGRAGPAVWSLEKRIMGIRPEGTRCCEQYSTLNGFQKVLLGITASVGAFQDPRRGDLVAIVGETTGERALGSIAQRMRDCESGRRVLEKKPTVTDGDTLDRLRDHSIHTFGGAYYAFMSKRGFHADERPPVRFLEDPEIAYVATRARQVHDFWHVLFDCHTDVLGEAALKAVEFVQTGMPMTGMAVIAAEWRLDSERRRLLNTVYLPWAVRAGSRCVDLMCLYYEDHFDDDIEELRRRWRIEKSPRIDTERQQEHEKEQENCD